VEVVLEVETKNNTQNLKILIAEEYETSVTLLSFKVEKLVCAFT